MKKQANETLINATQQSEELKKTLRLIFHFLFP